MRINQSKGNDNYKLHLTKKELNLLTIAIGLIDIPTMEDELEEQGLKEKDVAYNHLELFDILTNATGLYQYPREDK